ncbi:hypothetical protein V5O48_008127 [Marasmius crinis-equi]|uniref:F-box domain-containing protein n=1 Tax=Marasmius crinis-equi TaxID=585013 RepID=A0ABR3FEY5_9AGAR
MSLETPESPFTHVLGTNYQPTATEIEEVKAFLRDPEAEYNSIQEEIAKLRARQDELDVLINQHSALTSSVRRLPDEVLKEIFIQCLPDYHLPTRDLDEAPLLLTTVTNSWRQVALSTPALWNRIYIHLPSISEPLDAGYGARFQQRLEGTRRWLERSSSLPLSIFLNVELEVRPSARVIAEESSVRLDLVSRFLQLLMEHYQRWKRVALHVASEALFLPKIPGDCLPLSLEYLEVARTFDLDGTSERRTEGSFDLMHLLLRAPALKSLHFWDERVTSLALELPAQLHNLTDLKFTFHPPTSDRILQLSSAQALRLLSRFCGNLRSVTVDLTVDNTALGEQRPVASTVIAFPQLVNLLVRFKLPGDFSLLSGSLIRFFESIITPRLNDFGIHLISPQGHMHEDLGHAPFTFITSFLQRSRCHDAITSFSLAVPLRDTTVIDLLRGMPNLEKLRIIGDPHQRMKTVEYDRGFHYPPDRRLPVSTATEDLLLALTPSCNSTVLCPHLQHVEFPSCNPALGLSFLTFGQARMTESTNHAALRSFNVDFWRPLSRQTKEEVARRLGELRESGMAVRWRATPGGERLGPDDPRSKSYERDPSYPFTRNQTFTFFTISY